MASRRDMMEQGMNYTLVPDLNLGTYGDHVGMRTSNFVFLLYLTAEMLDHFKIGETYRTFLSDKAEGQVGSGFRLGKDYTEKWDAAHMCNCTFRKVHFTGAMSKQSIVCSSQTAEMLEAIYTMSSATTPQFQKANVSADKVIDSWQTEAKNKFLNACQSGNRPSVEDFLQDYLKTLAERLADKLETILGTDSGSLAKKAIYEKALETVGDQWKNAGNLAWNYAGQLQIDFAKIAEL